MEEVEELERETEAKVENIEEIRELLADADESMRAAGEEEEEEEEEDVAEPISDPTT